MMLGTMEWGMVSEEGEKSRVAHISLLRALLALEQFVDPLSWRQGPNKSRLREMVVSISLANIMNDSQAFESTSATQPIPSPIHTCG
jgi:hypothetical protein